MVCDVFSHMHIHSNTRVMSMQAHLRQFHLEVQEGRGAIPIDLETPASLKKKQISTELTYIRLVGAPP